MRTRGPFPPFSSPAASFGDRGRPDSSYRPGRPGLSKFLSFPPQHFAAALLVLLALFVGAQPETARAQSSVLVSNIAQTGEVGIRNVGSGGGLAQAFTTGDNAAGYALESIQAGVMAAEHVAQLTVSLYSESSDVPGSSLQTLTNPTPSSTGEQTLEFTSPGGRMLAANTTYFVVFECGHQTSFCAKMRRTSSDAEDAGAASGWSIGDGGHSYSGTRWNLFTHAIRIGVKGSAKTAAANTAAMGTPTISGTTQVGKTLTAVTTGISDTDGLDTVAWMYQWMRVDSDGTSNPVNVGTDSETYEIQSADLGKRLKVRVSFSDDVGNQETLTSAATGTVTAPVPEITIARQAASVTEGTAARFTVSASPAPVVNLDVSLGVADAAGLGDFVASGDEGSKMVTISAGAASATYSVPTVGDAVDEPNGSVTVSLGTGTGYTLGTAASASVTVNDNDAEPSVSVTRPSVTEGNMGTVTLDFVVSLSGLSAYPYRCNTLDEDSRTTATPSTDTVTGDYEPKDDNTLSFLTSQTLTFSVTVNGDTVSERNEKVLVRCRRGTLAGVTISGTITDDEPITASITAGTSPVTEGTAAEFTIKLSKGPPGAVMVKYTVAEASGSDFVATVNEGEKMVSFTAAPGDTSPQKTVNVPTVNDRQVEDPAAVTATLAAGTGYTVASAPNNAASVTVNSEDTNASPVIGGSSAFSVDENDTSVTRITATDADSDDTARAYSVSGGADASKFEISSSGALAFKTAPDWENPTDVASMSPQDGAGNNVYVVTVRVTSGTGGRSLSTDKTLKVTVDDVDEPPGAPSPMITTSTPRTLAVEWTAPTNTGPAITDYGVRYRKGSSGSFTDHSHSGTGLTTTITGLDPNSSYQVQVRATNAEGSSAWASGQVTGMTAMDRPPVLTVTDTTPSVAENETAVPTTLSAADPDMGDGITGWSLGGADASKFSISDSGALTFSPAPDYDRPADVSSTNPQNNAANNEYIVTVIVKSGVTGRELSDSETLTVTVTNVPEAPGTPSPTVTASTPTTLDIAWAKPANNGPEIDDYDVRYKLASADDSAFVNLASHAGTTKVTTRTATITGLTPSMEYVVEVRARNPEGDGAWGSVTRATLEDNAPTFAAGTPTAFTVNENDTEVHEFEASDGDPGDMVLSYGVSGPDGEKFDITDQGALTFKTAPDYENPTDDGRNRVYNVTVTVNSGVTGRTLAANRPITVRVRDVAEAPGVPSPTVTQRRPKTLTVAWDEPANTGPPINDYDVRYRKGSGGGYTTLTHNGTAREALITGLEKGTSYEVEVRARSLEGSSDWGSVTVDTDGFEITVTAGVESLEVSWPGVTGGNFQRVRWKVQGASDQTRTTEIFYDTTTRSYTIPSLSPGTAYEVEVSIRRTPPLVVLGEDVATGTPLSPPVAENNLAMGTPTITGTARAGETLTADTSGIMDTDGLTLVSYTYQWLRGDPGTSNHANISGASGFQYLVGANDVGKTLRVRVNFTDDLGNPETLTSGPTATVTLAPGVTVDPPSLNVDEDGGMGTFTVVLNTNPGASVTVSLSSSAPAAARVSHSQLIFTSSNWSSPRTVTVTGVDDSVDNPGNRRVAKIRMTYSSSSSDYSQSAVQDRVTVNVIDDETGGGGGGSSPNRPPVFPSGATAQTAYVDQEFIYTAPEATDPDEDPIDYAAALRDGSALPGWLSFDEATRTFSGTPEAGDAPALFDIEVTASDDGSPALSAATAFTLTVEECRVSDVSGEDESSLVEFVECAARRIAASDALGGTLALLERFRDPEGNWNDGRTYLVLLTEEGGVYFHAARRESEDRDWSALPCAEGGGVTDIEVGEGCPVGGGGYAHRFSASHVPLANGEKEFLLLGGFGGSSGRETLSGDIADPSTEAGDVASDGELMEFVEDAKESLEMAIGDDADPSGIRATLRDGEGPWKAGEVYVYIMDEETGRVIFDGGDREKEQTEALYRLAALGRVAQYREGSSLLRGYAVRVNAGEDEASREYVVGSGYLGPGGGGEMPPEERPPGEVEGEVGGDESAGGGCAVGADSGGRVFPLLLLGLALFFLLPLGRFPAEDGAG